MSERISVAVILAAGMGSRLASEVDDRPKGLMELGDRPIIGESVSKLLRSGVDRIILVTGYMSEKYEAFAAGFRGSVVTVHNERFAASGSMYSLYLARDLLEDEDFLLLESDLIYEERALREVLQCAGDSCILLSDWTESGDEVFVAARDGRLVAMSKDRSSLPEPPLGELVGITRISAQLFRHMEEFSAKVFERDLMVDYETDCLVGVADRHPIACRMVEGLLWAEIDDPAHLERARTVVYPAIQGRDPSPAP